MRAFLRDFLRDNLRDLLYLGAAVCLLGKAVLQLMGTD